MSELRYVPGLPSYGAQSVRYVAKLLNPSAAKLMDRRFELDGDFVRSLLGQSLFDWESRDLSLVLNPDGSLKTRNLDLFSFLVPLAEKQLVVSIPSYRGVGTVIRETNEKRVGEGVYGPLRGLVSNQDTCAFSLSIYDQNLEVTLVNGSKKIGWVHNYMMVDHAGKPRKGFDTLIVNIPPEEEMFKNLILNGNRLAFKCKHFVHPNRWQSVYGAPYLLLKLLLIRLKDEVKFCNDEIGRLKNMGIRGQKPLNVRDRSVSYRGPKKNIEVDTIQFVLEMAHTFYGSYKRFPNSLSGLMSAHRRKKELLYHFVPMAQFVTRADETAYFLYGLKNGSVAHWMRGARWEDNYRRASGRILWRRMPLSETGNMALLYRERRLTKQVSATE